MDARTFEFYLYPISMCVNATFDIVSWEPVGGWLAAEAPSSSQYRHCGRANHACEVRYDPIWRYQMKRNESYYEWLWTSMKPHNCCFKLKPSFLTYRFCVFASLKKSNFSSGPGRWKYSWGTSGTHFFTFTSSVKTVLSPTGKKKVTHTTHAHDTHVKTTKNLQR